jgi:gluconolactonase
VIAADAKWTLIWADFVTADGIVGTPDGGAIFAQEQTSTIKKIDLDGHETTNLNDTHGAGAIAVDAAGRMFAVQRTCTDQTYAVVGVSACQELPMVSQLAPERRLLANGTSDGKSFPRPNDVIGDGKGGAFFTISRAIGGAFHVTADGVVTVVTQGDISANGLMLSRDSKVLYVTNDKNILAWDVQPDGTVKNRRVFVTLPDDSGADGLAIDSEGRLYATCEKGIEVFAADGKHLGLIPTPRRAITLTFTGPGKKTLVAPMMGAIGPDGKEWATRTGVRNTAMTIYKIDMLAEGFKSRPK